jgi:hypothetical protein
MSSTHDVIYEQPLTSDKLRSQPKSGRSVRFQFNRNRIFANDTSISFKGSQNFGFGSIFGQIIRLCLLFTKHEGKTLRRVIFVNFGFKKELCLNVTFICIKPRPSSFKPYKHRSSPLGLKKIVSDFVFIAFNMTGWATQCQRSKR